MNNVRSKDRDLCVHESLVSKDVGVRVGSNVANTPLNGSKCPLALAKLVAGSAGAMLEAPEGTAAWRDAGGGNVCAAGGVSA